MSFEVIQPGFLSMIQDQGRLGFMNFGITQSGVMNERSHFWVNKLLNNPINTATIEMTLGGLQLKANKQTIVAVVGDMIPFSINKENKPINSVHVIKKGDLIEFGFAKIGLRFYIGVKGGFDIEKIFGSNSTDMKSQIGGLKQGKPLKAGDKIPFKQQPISISETQYKIPEKFLSKRTDILTLRVILGYQEDWFSEKDKKKFFSSIYTISNLSDRTGYRLIGEAILSKTEKLISEGLSFGAVQIPKDGQPIILLKDKPTMGGYPKIGTVFSLDAYALSDRKPGEKICFELFNLKAARKKLQKFYSFFGVVITQ